MKKRGLKLVKTPKIKAKETEFVAIDYPADREIIMQGSYSVRVRSSESYIPEVSIDGGSWKQCRPSVGFWWYDWDGFSVGTHMIEARIRKGRKLLKKIVCLCTCQ